MRIRDLLRRLNSFDAVLTIKGDRLHLDAPAGVLTDELKAEILENKPALLRLLTDAPACSGCRNLRMTEVPWNKPPYHRVVWGCAHGHVENGLTLLDLPHLRAPMSCLAAGDYVPVVEREEA